MVQLFTTALLVGLAVPAASRLSAVPAGTSYCTYSPDKKCYASGWPRCCSIHGGANCPSEQPACDIMGASYCTYSPDTTCYASGWPRCCSVRGGASCPSEKPACDIMGASYCAYSPDKTCYASGWPHCCSVNRGASCPSEQPPCDIKSSTSSLLAVPVGTKCERGVTASKSCGEGMFCKLDNSSSCPSAQHRTFVGTCVQTGHIMCPLNWAPVCGCDDQTYGNECAADANGVDIKHQGECRAGEDEVAIA